MSDVPFQPKMINYNRDSWTPRQAHELRDLFTFMRTYLAGPIDVAAHGWFVAEEYWRDEGKDEYADLCRKFGKEAGDEEL